MSDTAATFKKIKDTARGGAFLVEKKGSTYDMQVFAYSDKQSTGARRALMTSSDAVNKGAGTFVKEGSNVVLKIEFQKGSLPEGEMLTKLKRLLAFQQIEVQREGEAAAEEERMQAILATLGTGKKSAKQMARESAKKYAMESDDGAALDLFDDDGVNTDVEESDVEKAERIKQDVLSSDLAGGLDFLGDLGDDEGVEIDDDKTITIPSFMKLQKSRLAWVQTRSRADKLLVHLAKETETFSQDEGLGDGSSLADGIKRSLHVLGSDLEDSLDALLNARNDGDDAAKPHFKATLKELDRQEKLLESDPVLNHIQDNPWKIDILGPMAKSIQQMKAAFANA